MKRFEGKVALVTGAASGIGLATAVRLAQEGAAGVAVVDINESVKETAGKVEALGAKALALTCDISNVERVNQTVAAVVAAFDRLDVLCNVAGILRADHTVELKDENWDKVIRTNLYGTFYMCRAALPHLVDGAILVEGGVGGGGQDPTDAVMAWFESWPVPFVDATAAAEHLGGGPVGRAWAAGLGVTPEGLVPRFDPDVLRSAIEAVHATERWAEWRDITGSLLLVRAQNGYLAGEEARRMLEENARARLVEVADAGHDVHLDSAEAVAAAIRTFARNDVS